MICMSFDNDSYENPIEGKTYISPQIKDGFGDEKFIRLITRGIDQEKGYKFVKIKNDIALRETPGGKNIIRATVFEDPRSIKVLSIQEYTPATGNPHKIGFSFIGDEIPKLYRFLKDVMTMHFEKKRYQVLSDDDIEHIQITDTQAYKLFLSNKEMFLNIIKNKITNEDIINIGYRISQLNVFENLLNNDEYFERLKNHKNCKTESLWQQFFEKNQWIFGYGLGYIFLTGLDNKKLEQVVQGYDVNTHGKRVDGLMKTRAIISNLCFVEIKTHKTKLLDETAYRAGCFAPSKELAGAISQVQGTVFEAVKNLSEKISMNDTNGNPTGEEVYNFKPKSYLVIGNLNEFNTEYGINTEKLRSFELFRKNIYSPEIITFDELYERAKFITKFDN